jgi:hypothetical protein
MDQSFHVLYRIGQVYQSSLREDVARERQGAAAARRDRGRPHESGAVTVSAWLVATLSGPWERWLSRRDRAARQEPLPAT